MEPVCPEKLSCAPLTESCKSDAQVVASGKFSLNFLPAEKATVRHKLINTASADRATENRSENQNCAEGHRICALPLRGSVVIRRLHYPLRSSPEPLRAIIEKESSLVDPKLFAPQRTHSNAAYS